MQQSDYTHTGRGARLTTWLLQQQSEGEICATHQQVAEEMGSSREVISRLLKDWKTADWSACHAAG
ncbi:MAG: helix-turn-helix domain-containing protein [Pseudomonadota bacterium]|nr:helix-turn-helix domain-containing protein [Pseudomonadota bacterium]